MTVHSTSIWRIGLRIIFFASVRKICFHIQKGGVGKTSVSGAVDAGLARRGKKTVFVDADPQGNASSWYCGMEHAFRLS